MTSECTLDWGCMCPRCKDRQHPLDIAARLSPEEIEKFADQSEQLHSIPSRGNKCVSCEKPGTLYCYGRFCDDHKDAPRKLVVAYLSEGHGKSVS